MIKKTITYEDYDGNERTEDFYFNFSKMELLEMELEYGGIEDTITRLTQEQDGHEVFKMFKSILLAGYGEKSSDGKRFVKNDDIRINLEASPALSEIVFGFIEDPTSGAKFLEGMLPSKLVAEIHSEEGKRDTETVELGTAAPVLEETKTEEVSDEDLLKMNPMEMTPEQLKRAYILKSKQ